MENPILILGANPLGRIAKEIFDRNGRVVYGFLDDQVAKHQTEVDAVLVLGATDDDGFLKLIGKKCDSFVASDDTKLRKSLVEMLNEERHVQPVNAIHDKALLATSATIGHGNLIDAQVLIGPGSVLGSHCLVQAGVIINAEVTIGDFVQIGSGSIINSGVTIENDVFIGTGVTIVGGITLGKGCRIGAGSVVIGAVKQGETVFGNPAQSIKS